MTDQLDPKKIAHLPVLKEEQRGGAIGYFDRKPVEIGEIVLEASRSNFTHYGTIPQKEFPQRRMLVYALGRSEEGELILGDSVDDNSGLVKKGEVLLGILDYRTPPKLD